MHTYADGDTTRIMCIRMVSTPFAQKDSSMIEAWLARAVSNIRESLGEPTDTGRGIDYSRTTRRLGVHGSGDTFSILDGIYRWRRGEELVGLGVETQVVEGTVTEYRILVYMDEGR
jgi:hypothetical protein